MNTVAERSADAFVYSRCPKQGCGATLRIKPKSSRSKVTCGHCGFRFTFDVDESRASLDFDSNTICRKPQKHESRRKPIVAALLGLVILAGGIIGGILGVRPSTVTTSPPTSPHVESTSPTFVAQEPAKPDPPVVQNALGPKKKANPAPPPKNPSPPEPPVDATPRAPVREDVVERVKKSTALIEEKDKGWGTGFVIRKGIVMTNAHVVAGISLDKMTVSFVSIGDTAPPKIKPMLLHFDKRRDLAILRVDTDRAPLEFTPSGTDLSHMEVAVIGNPRGDAGQAEINKVTTGKLSVPIRRDAGWTYYELSAQAYFGNSGGPVVDAKTGKLVGVMQSILGDGKNKSYCIPYGEAIAALDQLPNADKQEAANRVATARCSLEVIASRLPEMETKADIAMNAQCLRLLGKSAGLEFLFKLPDGTTVSLSDYLDGLKDLFKELSPAAAKAKATIDRASSQIPKSLRDAVSLRLESCWAMYNLANSTTNTLKGFEDAIAKRKATNSMAVKRFETEYSAYLDSVDTKTNKGK